MKRLLLTLTLTYLLTNFALAQTGREVRGTVIDSTKLSIPGASIKLTSTQGDSSITAADVDGKFVFSSVKGTKITLTISSIGFQTLIKHYSFDAGTEPIVLDPIVLQLQRNLLNQVTITGAPNPVQLKEDTVEYKVSAYKVRDNAPIEDAIKKMPGIDVDKDGNVTAQGKQVTRVRLNGKDFFGGDLQTATKNLPADIVESIQIVDDYGDQANLTGVKTGEPNKILNINIRKDRNYGYSLQATAGDGTDALPNDPGINNENRYLGMLNFFNFNGNQQISVLGNLNNTNLNTFSFSSPSFGGFGGNFGGGGNRGGGGGGGRAFRGGGGSGGGQTTATNGITNAKSLGVNFRDEWAGGKLSVYGSYSFNNNRTFTETNEYSLARFEVPQTTTSNTRQISDPINHRLNFNVEWRPDTVNYFKITPTFSYSRNNSTNDESTLATRGDATNLAYTLNSVSNSETPNFGINALYNHRFNSRGRNLSFNVSYNTAKNDQYENPIYVYTQGVPTSPLNQQINTDSRTNTWATNLSYLEPLSKVSFLELNYAFNHSYTSADKSTDTLNLVTNAFDRYDFLSNSYNYTFTTNRVGLNYRFVESNFNYTLGIGVQPGTLKGNSINAPQTVRNTFNVIPTARLVYNFTRNKSLNFNYSGNNSQPSFNQLQPVYDFSNALYPTLGNPNLKPEFQNNFSLRYNNFSFETGNVFFSRLEFNQYSDRIVSQTTTYPTNFSEAALAADPSLKNLQNTNLTTYTNTGGFYNASAFAVFSKPWAERKYTLFLNGNISYNNNIGFSRSIDSNNVATDFQKSIAKNLVFTPGVRFRVNITDIVDAEVNTSYAINKTVSSINGNTSALVNQNTNARTLSLGVNGKNYFWKDWTLSYDFTRQVNYGYNVPVTNPNILNVYVERRFLKNNMATIRVQGVDLLNQNRGFTSTDNGITTTQSNVNRLSRYFLLTFSLRLQKFAGSSPNQNRGRNRDNVAPNGPGGQGGPGGPPPGGPGMM
ncbi:TonB-dependent receptor [Mucilaginibacter limnophilus]|uniref:TonB-dependent receptor n=1 Tax=Mucilaginibacter limnophilus TaxID=1932778 RepID=A0A3S2WW81_9SPHI|nr:outer membrane beta-barrel protein [Mucilaginibacter limnophilus]RVT98145.1 TonB-dependent receptor [Mucilaginibacter limnophilus]